MTTNPYAKLVKEAQKNGADKSLVWAYQQKGVAWNEGYMERAKEIEQLKAEIKAWIKEMHVLERKGKQLIEGLIQFQKDWVREFMKEENSK